MGAFWERREKKTYHLGAFWPVTDIYSLLCLKSCRSLYILAITSGKLSFWKWRQVKESKMKNTLKCYEKWQHCRLINSVLIATKEVRPMLIWQSDHLSVHHAVGFCKCTENVLHSSWQSCCCCLFIIYRLHCIHTNLYWVCEIGTCLFRVKFDISIEWTMYIHFTLIFFLLLLMTNCQFSAPSAD